MASEPQRLPVSEPAAGPDADLHARKESLRRRLLRANFAAVVILLVVVALAAGFVWKARESAGEAERANEEALRANREAARAHAATEQAEAQLWNSRLSEVRARRMAGGPGARVQTRSVLEELSRRPDLTAEQRLALRQEAIEQMALLDIEIPRAATTNSTVAGLVWSHDLKSYFRFRGDGAVEIVEHPSGTVRMIIPAIPGTPPHTAAFSPDNRLAAIRHHGGLVRVWDLTTNALRLATRCVRVPGSDWPLLFAPDSRTLAMMTTSGVALVAMDRPELPPRILQQGRVVDGIVFTADGTKVAVVPAQDRDAVEVWDVAGDAMLRRFNPGFPPRALEWHPDGRRLALAGSRGRLGIWEMNSPTGATNGHPRESVRLNGHLAHIVYLMFTPDGTRLYTQAWDSTCRFWDVLSGAEVLRETRVTVGAISSDGRSLVGSRSPPLRESVCRLIAPTGFHTLATADEARATHGVWISPDGRLLAASYPPATSGGAGETRLWDFQRRVELARVPGRWTQFSPDGRWLYAFEFGGIRRFDVRAETLAAPPDDWARGRRIYEAAPNELVNTGEFSADGRWLVVAAMDRVLWLDAESGELRGKISVPAHYVSQSPDGSRITTTFQNQPAVLRPLDGRRELAKGRSFGKGIFSPDTNWLAVAEADIVHLLRHPSIEPVFSSPLDLGASAPPPLAFSPDSRMLAVAYNRVGIRLHEVPSGRVLATFTGTGAAPIAGARGIAFSPDSRWLVAARDSGDVVGWELDVMRRELTALGLDWDQTNAPAATKPPADSGAATAAAALTPAKPRRAWLESVALIAALVTLAGGLLVFAVQRRLLASHERLEAIALEQNRRLDSARTELMHGQKMRALGTLAAGIAHDFNNLLSVIRLSNQLAAEQTGATGMAKENMDTVESAVAQGESIVQSMLGYSRAAAGLETHYAVDAVVNETVAMLGRKFLAGIILKLELEPRLPPASGSRGRLEQMLLNLIVNASEAMSGQGVLSIRAGSTDAPAKCLLTPRPAPRYVELTVADSGPGIPPEILSRIFEPFFTTKTRSARPGTGLGLATVYTMAEQDGLGLGVETSDTAGTTFRIVIPAEPEKPPPAA